MTLIGSAVVDGTGNTLDNIITGNSAANVLSGGDGNDTIYGADGNDTIDGGIGNDAIYAGGGVDMLTGGAGNDTFVFTNISDSLPGSADLITDFTTNSGEGSDDQIDLSAIDADTGTAGDQAFTWAPGFFTPTAHSLWLSATPNPDGSDDWVLYGDVNGDTTPDFEIHFHTATHDALHR